MIKQAYQGLQPGYPQPADTEVKKKQPSSDTGIPESESLVDYNQPDSPQKSDLPSELSLVKESDNTAVRAVPSELLNDLPSSPPQTKENQNSLEVPHSLTGAALARRLNVSPSTLRHKKNARNFGQWTSGHDPDGIGWYFDGQKYISCKVVDIQ